MRILVSGSVAYDRIMDFPERFSDHILPDKIHILNVCFTVNGMKEQFGGTAGNIAYNLTLLNEKPLILASAGRDFDSYEKRLKDLGLSTKGIRIVAEEFTAGAYITTDKADNQITGFNPGAMKHPCLFSIDGLKPDETLAIIAPGCLEDMYQYSKLFKEKGFKYICDPGQSIPMISGERMTEMISGSFILISNDYELELIMRSTGYDKKGLLDKTQMIITTLGDRGSVITTKSEEILIPAVPAQAVIDPTGAGDAYRAGLIKGLVEGRSFKEAGQMGAVIAGYCVECLGTQCHTFTLEDYWNRYNSAFH